MPRTTPFGPPSETVTDGDGRFAFDRLASGEYRLDVQKTGYVSLAGFPGSTPPPTIHVAAGQATDTVSVQLQKGGVVAGRVLDASGEPLTDARVVALRRVTMGGAGPRYLPVSGPNGQTNDLGEFRISGVAPGDYLVAAATSRQFSPFGGPGVDPAAVSSARTTLATTYYPGTSNQAAAQTIAVSAGQTVDNVVFTMQSAPAFRVSGIVVDDSGNAVAGAMVMLMSDPRNGAAFMGPSGNTRTADDGRFVIGEVVPGTYRLTASVMVNIRSGRGAASGGAGAEVVAGVTGGIVGGRSGTSVVWSAGSTPGSTPTPTEIVVTDADVTGIRVTVRR